jgi:isoleucyl-tRNA synthetase
MEPTTERPEEQISAFWKQHNIFARSISERPAEQPFRFYDGPPFATGLPHYGHIVASTIKDVIPRYATMRGYRVERKWGWDCHGLPVENLIEKELGLKSKRDIEEMGVAKFNEACRSSVLKYTTEWRQTIERLGRWVDMDNDYRTMDPEFMESVWWVFKQLYDRGLIYEGKKAMHVCPRCVTPLSNFEVTLGYKDVDDTAVTWKFKVVGQPNTFLLAWTTTPWSTPGVTGLSVGPDFTYVKAQVGNELVIVVKDRVEAILRDTEYTILEEFPGTQLVGLAIEPIVSSYTELPDVKAHPNTYHVFSADYVEVTEGTGIVTINGAYGDIDMQAAHNNQLPLILDVDMDGHFNSLAGAYDGLSTKEGQAKLIADKQAENLVWRAETYRHSYPHCWRCDTPLLNYATSSWFVRVTQLKDAMIKNNDQTVWMPEHVKYGRFGKWLEGAKDWAISRERYWGAPLPVWKSDDGEVLCVGSRAELAQLSGQTVEDLHKESVDPITITKDGKPYHRINAVLDCWFESGSMPYAQHHYPFEQPEQFENKFPADFIAEGLDQTRGWFYTLTVLSTALFDQPAFKHVIVNGLVLAEDGKKMSKRLKNYPEPSLVMDKYGADALRFYLMSSPVVKAEDLRFSEKGVDLVMKKVMLTLWNVVSFYQMFKSGASIASAPKNEHIMDKWVLAKTHELVVAVTEAMDNYNLMLATSLLENFIQDLSTWYLRRSRQRFKDATTQAAAMSTLHYVLDVTAKLMAPFTPFMAERIYQVLNPQAITAGDSIHLALWPTADAQYADPAVLADMVTTRQLVEQILAMREEHAIKVRQPLAHVMLPQALSADCTQILLEEVNIKSATVGDALTLDTAITPELAAEGMLRELVRSINALRKQQKLTLQDHITITYQTSDALVQQVFTTQAEQLQQSVLAKALVSSTDPQTDSLKVNGATVTLTLNK